jgi:phosphatidylserine decarboxylase
VTELLKAILIPINRAGWPFLAGFAVVTLGLFWVAQPLGWVGAAATAWCTYFFRDPDRVTPVQDGLVVSPADGMVLPVEEALPPEELDLGAAARTRISIFMNVFDVHVNRAPCDGVVRKVHYRPGKFFNASLDKASEHNERMAIRIAPGGQESEGTTGSRDLAVVQIAGLLARRIKCELSEGQTVSAGARFGLIRFGSRLDVYLPPGVEPLVAAGQRMIAGETVLADLRSNQPARPGEVR